MYNYLKNIENYVKKHLCNCSKTTNWKKKRAILKHAFNRTLTAKEMVAETEMRVSVKKIRRITKISEITQDVNKTIRNHHSKISICKRTVRRKK